MGEILFPFYPIYIIIFIMGGYNATRKPNQSP